jgi:tRNA(fMet)-specific endonuclease VapC
MAYLLDTDIIIYHLNGVIVAHSLLQELRSSGMAISAVTYMETVDGLANDPNSVAMRQRFEMLVGPMPVLPFASGEADRCAGIRSMLRQQGKGVRPRVLDLMIAATALEHGMTLVTNNPADYDDIPGLIVEAARIVSDR